MFTDGRGGVDWNANGELVGIADRFFDDMDAALEIARVDEGAVVPGARRLRVGRRSGTGASRSSRRRSSIACSIRFSIDTAPTARFTRSTSSTSPIGSREGLATNPKRGVWPIANLKAFVGGAADRIHARSSALVTLGGGQVRFAREWDDAAYGLDFVQVHSYPDVRYQDRDVSCFGKTAADFGLSKPLLIGECPVRASSRGHACRLLNLAREGGYLGAWPWSFKGVDAFGAPAL